MNAYLNDPACKGMEQTPRSRAVGARFLDHADQPLEASLSMFPDSVTEHFSFKVGKKRAAMSFVFRMDIETRAIQWHQADVFESVVQCDAICSLEAAGQAILNQPASGGEKHDVKRLLQGLFKHACAFEVIQEARNSFAVLSEMDMNLRRSHDLTADVEYAGFLGTRLLQVYMCAVNQAAGHRLRQNNTWNQLLAEGGNSVCLSFFQGKIDPCSLKVIERFFRVPPGSPELERKRQEILGAILEQRGLSPSQKQSLATSFHRRLRSAMPYECYIFQEELGGPLESESVFRVTQPLENYMDILGMRALKCQLGWEVSAHLQMTKDEGRDAQGNGTSER